MSRTSAEHYSMAEKIIQEVAKHAYSAESAPNLLAAAHIHATLALAAAVDAQRTHGEGGYGR